MPDQFGCWSRLNFYVIDEAIQAVHQLAPGQVGEVTPHHA
jgi:hypothetical protein